MKRIIASLIAGIMLFSVSGCWQGEEASGATLNIDLSLSYISEQTDYMSKQLYPELTTDNGILLSYPDNGKDRAYHSIFWNAETAEFSEVTLHSEGKNHGSPLLVRLPDGKVGYIYQSAVCNGKNWEFTDANAYMDIYSSDLTYMETIPFSLDTNGDAINSFCTTVSGGKTYFLYEYHPNGYIAFWGEQNEDNYMEIGVLDEQLQYVDSVYVQNSCANIVQGASGTVYVASPLNPEETNCTWSRLDLENMQPVPIDLSVDKRFCGREFLTGTNGYEMYTAGQYGICGVTLNGTEMECEQVMDFRNSDFLAGDWLIVAPSPDGRFLVRESNQKSKNMWLSRKRTDEEMKTTQVITMAGVGFNEQLTEVITRYNRSHSDYRIMMLDYMDFVEENPDEGSHFGIYLNGIHNETTSQTKAAANLFLQDLLNGIVPDIICTDNLPYVQLANKGIFLDMTELMEKDEHFHEEDYVMSFFDSMKYKGQQQTIAFSFYLNTLAGKTELVGNEQGLSVDAYLNMLSNAGDAKPFEQMQQETYKELFLPLVQNSFLDTEKVTCSFDTPAFVKLLEIGKSLPRTSNDEWFGYEEYEMRDGKALLTVQCFSQPIDYQRLRVAEFGRQDITLVGFPVISGGNGCIFSAPYTVGINALSKYPDKVWDIFMELMSEDIQRKLDTKRETYSFPVLRSCLEEDLEASAKGAGRMEVNLNIGKNSEEDVAMLKSYIKGATMFYYADPTITDIIIEEADMYYAGDQSAEEAAKKIQSRAGLYLSEQY